MKNILTIFVLSFFVSVAHAQSNKSVVTSKPQTTARKPQTTARKPQAATAKPVQKTQGQVRKTPAAKAAPGKKSVLNLCPDNKHPHAIDLGLPSGILWACCNVGAELPEEFGGLYAWGEVKEKKAYTPMSYKYFCGSAASNWDSDSDYTNSYTFQIFKSDKDVAYVTWGNDWQMPRGSSMRELIDNCVFEYITLDSISGGKFTGPNGNAIFLTAAGLGGSSNRYIVGVGHYSAGDRGSYSAPKMHELWFRPDWCAVECLNTAQYSGFSVRPVKDDR